MSAYSQKRTFGAVTTIDDVVAAATTSDLGGLGALRVVRRLVITIRSTTTGILAAGIPAAGILGE